MKKPKRLFKNRPNGYVVDLGLKLTPGQLHHVAVIHDHDCKMPKGGPCTCTPEVKMLADYRREQAEKN